MISPHCTVKRVSESPSKISTECILLLQRFKETRGREAFFFKWPFTWSLLITLSKHCLFTSFTVKNPVKTYFFLQGLSFKKNIQVPDNSYLPSYLVKKPLKIGSDVKIRLYINCISVQLCNLIQLNLVEMVDTYYYSILIRQ